MRHRRRIMGNRFEWLLRRRQSEHLRRVSEAAVCLIVAFILTLTATGAAQETAQAEPGSVYAYVPPPDLGDGWKVSTLSDVGLDEDKIVRVTNGIIEGKYRGIHSMLIFRHNRLVHEAYFQGYERDDLQILFSITKSVTSALIGIAIDQALIDGVDQPLVSLISDYARYAKDNRFAEIKLRDVLMMASGLEWQEIGVPYCDPQNSQYQQVRTDDWIKAVVELPVVDDPGTRWVYNTGSTHVLSAVIKNATGMYADEFADEVLFAPLGITEYAWNKDPNGYPCTGGTHGGLRLRARDLAKFGYVFMNEGMWDTTQVISPEWVKESTTPVIDALAMSRMGYLWWSSGFTQWSKKVDFIYAAGYGGQSLHLVPDLDLMVMFLCWDNPEDADIFAPMLIIHSAALKNQKEVQNEGK
jgi:CubicO group peptidase (beta-lactamase class C family)